MQSLGQAIVTDSISGGKLWTPTMLRIGYDLIGPLQNAISRSRGGWEITGETDFNKFNLIAEFGNEHFDYGDNATYHYRADGNYFRLGFDYNMIPRDEFGSELFFGFRYATGNFDETLAGVTNVFQWGSGYMNEKNSNVSATWLEFTAGMRAKVWKQLYMGYTLRLKVAPSLKGEQNIETYLIPGYGLYSKPNFWSINYYVAWKFSFRQKYTKSKKIKEE